MGLALTRLLVECALKRGVRIFTRVVLFENKWMLNLLRDLGLPEKLRYEEGIEHVERYDWRGPAQLRRHLGPPRSEGGRSHRCQTASYESKEAIR